MPAESSKEPGQDHVESLIDDVIRDILNEASVSAKSAVRGRASTAALIETAIATPQTGSRASILERVLLAEAFAGALADALAPALADMLAPRVMKLLEQSMASEPDGTGREAGTSDRTRKQGGK
jgi:hypothetical protein